MEGSTRAATLPRTRCIWAAYGRAFMIRSCARRSLDAATIFIALVICCVFFTARIRRRRSIRDGMSGRRGLSRRKVAGKFLDRGVECPFPLIVELLLLDDPAEHLWMTRLDELIQFGLEGTDLRDRNLVELAVRA